MALNKEQLKDKIIEAFSHPSTQNNIETVAEKLANAIDQYVKEGIVVGVCPSGGGPLTQGKVQ